MKVLVVLLGLGYPFLVYLGLSVLGPRTLALVLGGVLALRLAFTWRRAGRRDLVSLGFLAGLIGAVLGLAAVFNEQRFLLFAPVAVNLALLVAFARTLPDGPSMVETFARLQGHTLSEAKVRYCRHVTEAWCAFFVANAAVIAWLALTARVVAWTVYAGVIAYGLVGIGFVVERGYRAWRFRDYRDGVGDAIMQRIFPPREVPP